MKLRAADSLIGAVPRVERAESSFYVPNRPVFGFDCEGPSATRQEFAEECDINSIMARYERTGVINHYHNGSAPSYVDFSDAPDFQTALDMLQAAETAFMQLPAGIRKTFNNDPREFVAFAENADNAEQLRAWGLAPPLPEAPPPTKVEVINPVSDDRGAGEAPPARKK